MRHTNLTSDVNPENKESIHCLGRSHPSVHWHSSLPFLGRKNDVIQMLPNITKTPPQEQRLSCRFNPNPSSTSAQSLEHGSQEKNNSFRGDFVTTPFVNDILGTPQNSFNGNESRTTFDAIDCHKISPSNKVECAFSGSGMLDGFSAFLGHDESVNNPIRKKTSRNRYPRKICSAIADETKNATTIVNRDKSHPRSKTHSQQPPSSTIEASVSSGLTSVPLNQLRAPADYARDDDDFKIMLLLSFSMIQLSR